MHGIRYLRICSQRVSADKEASEYFVDELMKMIRDEQIPYKLVYNADETSIFWRYVLKKTLATEDEKNPTGIRDMKEHQISFSVCQFLVPSVADNRV